MNKINFECEQCLQTFVKWVGQCSGCEKWNSLVEIKEGSVSGKGKSKPSTVYKFSEIKTNPSEKIKTEIKEFDRVLGNGFQEGSLSLLAGEPGVGKSTLVMKVLGELAKKGLTCLYVSGEESSEQIISRAKRLGIEQDKIYICRETSIEKIISALDELKPKFFVLDSIQTTEIDDDHKTIGSASLIKEVTRVISQYCKSRNIITLIIGHITKDGSISGPKHLEHMVDTVLYFEGDKQNSLRHLRSSKNRFGSTFEVGIFEMKENGLFCINDDLKIVGQRPNSFGCTTSVSIHGSRAIFSQVEALVIENKINNAKRVAQGIDLSRLNTLIAIAEKYLEISLANHDIYISISGSTKVNSRWLDLAVVSSILSSLNKRIIPANHLFIGELSLSGEVKPVSSMENIISIAKNRGYKKVILNAKETKLIIEVKNINELDKYMKQL